MRINSMSGVNGVYKANKAKKAYAAKPVEGMKDSVSLSSFAKELSVAKNAVDNVPDVRSDKVNAIKEQIKNGTYNVSAEQIADKIMGNL